jgi:aryl-alcohol dehydrogenase-like predicted oxidoreductase
VAFSWLAAQPTVASVIAGATKVEQIEQNSQAIVSLSQEDLAHIDEIFPAPNKIALF